MAPRASYFLQLPPELGGLRFGPFSASVSLGSDARRCQVQLDPSHGVYPLHVTVSPITAGVFSITPGTRDGKVFLIPYGQAHVWPVLGPVQAKVGDVLVLGTPHGPRFQLLEQAALGPAPTAGDVLRNASTGEAGLVHGVSRAVDEVLRPKSGGIVDEVKRRSAAAALAGQGPLRDGYVIWSRLRTQVFSNPYWVVVVLFGIVGIIGTGSVSCTGMAYVVLDLLGFGYGS